MKKCLIFMLLVMFSGCKLSGWSEFYDPYYSPEQSKKQTETSFQISSVTVVGDESGDGIISPGEFGYLKIKIKNIGDVATSISGAITSSNSYVTIEYPTGYGGSETDGTLSFGWLEPNEENCGTHNQSHNDDLCSWLPNNYLKVTIDSNSQPGDIPFALTLTDSDENQYVLNFTISTTGQQITGATLISISVTPTSSSVGIGYTQQFTATGTYSDNSTHNLTGVATWISSAPGVASISGGVLTGLSVGNVDVTAIIESITSQPVSVTVNPPSSGSLDLGFGVGGRVTGPYYQGMSSATFTDTGNIAIAGFLQPIQNSSKRDFAFTVYDENGALYQHVHTAMGTNVDEAYAIKVQSDGKIILGGGTSDCFNRTVDYYYEESACDVSALARYNTDTSLDTSFGIGGRVTTVFPGSSLSAITDIAIQSDGKIVVTGWWYASSKSRFLVARYTANGVLDNTFGSGGIVTTQIGTDQWSQSHSLEIQPDGKILVVGFTVTSDYFSSPAKFALVRYNTNGTLDTSFDGDGVAMLQFGTSHSIAYDLKLQSDGKIIVAGKTRYSDFYGNNDVFGVVRFNSNGSLDNTFGSSGIVIINFSDSGNYIYTHNYARSIGIQSDGKIVVGGVYGYYNFAMVRLNMDGTIDNSFGKIIRNVGNKALKKILIQYDDKIIAAGGDYGDVVIERYWP